MASVQDLKRRIRSVRNTRKITRAMELVAAAKLRRAQTRIEAMRPYADRMQELIAGVGRASSSVRLPLLEQREQVANVLIVPLTGDRGLAGAFNAQVIRRSFALERKLVAEGVGVQWLAVGKKGRSTLSFRRKSVVGEFVGFTDRPGLCGRPGDRPSRGRAVHERRGRSRRARLQHLRLRADAEGHRPGRAADLGRSAQHQRRGGGADDAMRGDFIYEPEPEEILARLLPVYLETQMYRALLESAASEQGARMTAMRNASKNAGELIDGLTLSMNRARQSEITQEILEVVGGAEALA